MVISENYLLTCVFVIVTPDAINTLSNLKFDLKDRLNFGPTFVLTDGLASLFQVRSGTIIEI
ncbi:hypothetical protein T01_13563 [Trichinella spiralis]|uniref:Uncharacterized protein n=1 Tax=Trichinella spiralis TaxID=6334 RepID=A0A0V1C0F1_TRISP|nr:hypothetical protein T01_13563 [Trichinella spiralis]